MEQLTNIWHLIEKYIVQSNAFNFVVMIVILGLILKKADLGSSLEKLKNDVISMIEKSKLDRENAKKELHQAENAVKNLGAEITDRLTSAEKRAEEVSAGILEDAENKVKNITHNITKAVETEEKTISSKLTSKTINASVELAKKHIIDLLKNNPELHDKYINESIEDLDKVKI